MPVIMGALSQISYLVSKPYHQPIRIYLYPLKKPVPQWVLETEFSLTLRQTRVVACVSRW